MNPRSFYISIGLHLGVVLLAIVGLPSLNRPLPEDQPLVTLEMVQTVPTTNVNEGGEVNTAKEEQQAAERKQPAPPPPPPKPAPSVPDTPSKPTPRAPDPTAEIIPEKPQNKPKLAEAQPPAPPKSKPQQSAAEKMPTKLPKAPPKRANKMAQQNELAKKRTDALTGVMQNLAKAKAVNEDAEKKRREQERKIAADKLNDSVSAAAGDVLKAPEKPVIGPLGLSDIDRLRAHLSKCWDPPIGAAGSDTLIVDIIVSLDRDGRVLSAKVDNKLRFNTDRIFKVAAEEAIRATRECSPLPLPPEKYEQWKSFVFVFDPRFLSR
ncbi:MAG: cell envelope integrity protein TolA [Alphaproteobacteria bacterium]